MGTKGAIELELVSESEAQTRRLGRLMGEVLAGDDIVALAGPLGAGKTQLVKGVAAGLGVLDEASVTSPTFVLVNEYLGRLRMYHVDAYRLSGPAELEAIGIEEMMSSGAVVVVEWADRVAGCLPERASWVEMDVAGQSRRLLRVRGRKLAEALRRGARAQAP
jgi:tRNA threonylcarbamoyladenosine biosynthesis protein TsaE